MDLQISKYLGGLKVSFLLKNAYRGNMEEDAVYFCDNYGGGGDVNWEWLYSDYIHFVFFYDPEKDEISHVRLQDKLILNDEIIQRGETEDTLLTIGSEDFYRPNSFWLEINAPSFLKYYRRLTKTEKLIEVIRNDILRTRDRFNKDEKGFIEILSRWARERSKKPRTRNQQGNNPLLNEPE